MLAKSLYLSEKERRIGQKNMHHFELFNGISYGMLGETLVYILAVKFFASNIILGLIPSLMFITSLIIPLVMPLLAGKNLKNTMFSFWMARGLVGIGYAALLIPGLSNSVKITILMIIFALYAFFRSVAMISYDPIAKSVTTLHNRGGYYATLNFAYNLMLLFAKLTASITMKFNDSVLAIVILEMLGVVGNCISCHYLSKIPCRLVYTHSKNSSYKEMFLHMIKSAKIRNRVALKFNYIGLSIVMGMSIPFVKIKLQLNDALVIVFTVIVSLAYLLGGAISRSLSDQVGAKPLMQISGFVAMLCIIFFMIAPPFNFWPFFIVGFIMNTAIQICIIQSGSLVMRKMPDNGGATYNVIVNTGMGIFGLLFGFLSGFLVDIGVKLGVANAVNFEGIRLFNDYSITFALGLLVSLVGLIMVSALKEKGAKSARQVMSIKNLQVVSSLKALESSTDTLYRRRQVMFLSENSSDFSFNEISRKLNSPYSRDLADILRVLGEKHRIEFLPSIIRIAGDDTNYMQIEAIRALANFPEKIEARRCLDNVFHNSCWVSCKSAAASSLSHFVNTSYYYPEVMELSRTAAHIEICIELLEAEYYMDDEKNLFARLFIDYSLSKSVQFRQTRYSCMDALLLQNDSISKIARVFERYNTKKDVRYAFVPCINDNMNVPLVERYGDDIIEALERRDAGKIYELSTKLIDGIKTSRPDIKNTIKGIRNFSAYKYNNLDVSDLMACIYFAIAVSSIIQG